MRAGRMGFLFIRKTASMGSSTTGALVAAGSLQPSKMNILMEVRQCLTSETCSVEVRKTDYCNYLG
jgi:hypothetical protein